MATPPVGLFGEPPPPKPPPAPKRTRGARARVTFDQYLATDGSIRTDDPVWAFADSVGLTDRMVLLCWREFKRRHCGERKTQADWPATFRNAVRGNWYGLWAADRDGNPFLTTAGKLADKEFAHEQQNAAA